MIKMGLAGIAAGMVVLVALTAWIPESSVANPGFAASMVAMLTLLGNQASPWTLWLGALPLSRRRWLVGELGAWTAAMAALLVPYWAAMAWFQAGADWSGWLGANAPALVLSLMAAPWSVAVGLTQRPGVMARWGWVVGMLAMVAWISGVSALGTPVGLPLAVASVIVSGVGAAVASYHLLTSRRGR